jgi:hypothetical protein
MFLDPIYGSVTCMNTRQSLSVSIATKMIAIKRDEIEIMETMPLIIT